MPGTAAATGGFVDEGAVTFDGMALVVPTVVGTAALGAGAPSGATPAVAIDVRLSVPAFCIGTEETGGWEAAVGCGVTGSFDEPVTGNWVGRFVNFLCGGRGEGVPDVLGGGVDVPASAGMTSGACRWIKLCGRGDTVASPAREREPMATTQNVAVMSRQRPIVAQAMELSFVESEGERVKAF